MNTTTRQRSGLLTFLLWIMVLAGLALTGRNIAGIFTDWYINEICGWSVSAICSLGCTLGIILLLKWSKNGFWLYLVSAAVLAAVGYFLWEEYDLWFLWICLGSILFIRLILLFRKNGQSAWSLLQKGWDGRHCRHIYQIFAAVGVLIILAMILILVVRGSSRPQPVPDPDPDDSVDIDTLVVAEPVESIVVDTLEPTPSKDQNPVEDEDNPHHYPAPNGKFVREDEKKEEKKNNKQTSTQDAVRYLDTHRVWVRSEMADYPELRHLNARIVSSLHAGHYVGPNLRSRRLQEIKHLFYEIERLRNHIGDSEARHEMKMELNRCRTAASENRIDVDKLLMMLRRIVNHGKYAKGRDRLHENKSSGSPEPPMGKKEKDMTPF